MKSYLTHLECTACGNTYSAEEAHRTCPSCGKVLYARYDLEAARREVDRDSLVTRPANMWRYFELMPVWEEENVLSLGEGMTPLLHAGALGAQLGCPHLFIKDESANPTGSFKARGLSAAVSKARELGITRLTMPSAGNAAGAVAAYCAKGGMEAHVFMPMDAPLANQQECIAFGAHLTLVDGLISDAGRLSREHAEREGLFDVSTLQEPYRAEGKKTMGYELAEQLGWRTPDVILYPTGGGTGIVGIWKAFQEMMALGWLTEVTTRMVAVQSDGCAPIVRAFHEGSHRRLPHTPGAEGQWRRCTDGLRPGYAWGYPRHRICRGGLRVSRRRGHTVGPPTDAARRHGRSRRDDSLVEYRLGLQVPGRAGWAVGAGLRHERFAINAPTDETRSERYVPWGRPNQRSGLWSQTE